MKLRTRTSAQRKSKNTRLAPESLETRRLLTGDAPTIIESCHAALVSANGEYVAHIGGDANRDGTYDRADIQLAVEAGKCGMAA